MTERTQYVLTGLAVALAILAGIYIGHSCDEPKPMYVYKHDTLAVVHRDTVRAVMTRRIHSVVEVPTQDARVTDSLCAIIDDLIGAQGLAASAESSTNEYDLFQTFDYSTREFSHALTIKRVDTVIVGNAPTVESDWTDWALPAAIGVAAGALLTVFLGN